MNPKLEAGSRYDDLRGKLYFNNSFDASLVKRIYAIENLDTSIMRGWRCHKIEQRWFSAINGSFKITLIKIDNWQSPSKNLEKLTYIIYSETLDILHIPAGFATCIQSIENNSKLLVMADFCLGEQKDDYYFDIDYFD